jgi:hypothetical protein
MIRWINEISDTRNRGLELLNLPDVVNDLDVDLAIDPVAAAAYINDQRNLRKIREHTAKLQLNIINPPRPGKRLLVLDIDYSELCVVLVLDILSSHEFSASDTRYQTTDLWGASSGRVRTTGAPRVPGDGIPLLRYLHLVRRGEPDGRTAFHYSIF